MKTADLLPPVLDYWVAKASGCHGAELTKTPFGDPACYIVPEGQRSSIIYMPSRTWHYGGPLIEKYKIHLEHFRKWDQVWAARIFDNSLKNGIAQANADTPLIAAMRAIVASVYGSSVDDRP